MLNNAPANLNVLLLLSYDQKPAPDEEIIALESECSNVGHVYFATTRNIGTLSAGAEVAFYADGQDNFSLLATAEFDRFLSIDDREGREILSRHTIYGAKQPERMRGFVRLKGLKLWPGGTSVDTLNGWLADGDRLTLENLPQGHAAASIYYMKPDSHRCISIEAKLELSQAKCAELEDKYADTRRLWDREVRWKERIHRKAIADLRNQTLEGKRPSGGGRVQLKRTIEYLLNLTCPNIRLNKDSIDCMVRNYDECPSLFKRLMILNNDPLLYKGIPGGKAIQGSKKGWFRARFGDDLGRMYYRRVLKGRDAIVEVRISQKDEQSRDLDNL